MGRFLKNNKCRIVGLLMVLVLAVASYAYYRLHQPLFTAEVIAAKRAAALAQNEFAVPKPPVQAFQGQPKNPHRNVYFGDLHVHSKLSFDGYIFGNRLDVDDAYRFAKGEVLQNPAGELMQLTRPLDFAAITDHAEGFALDRICRTASQSTKTQKSCALFDNPTAGFFLDLRDSGSARPMRRFDMGVSLDAQVAAAEQTWAHVVAMAQAHNQPGRFTSFAAYEYSPPLPDRGKIHRNVIFRNEHVPPSAISAYDAATEIDLWRQLNDGCQRPCQAISIPHNPNKSWGLAFAGVTIDGDVYQPEDWATRAALEPLVEMFQIKGSSECAIGVNTTDEACAFEQFLPACSPDAHLKDSGCIHPSSMARDGLKKGLQLKQALGFNPMAFGLIGSSDTHNSNPGDVEEWDYRGAAAALTAPATARIQANKMFLQRNPGGLAAIWAPENTRDALFDAMQRKEVYATSGTRIKLRFYGSTQDLSRLTKTADLLPLADALAVPMGGQMSNDNGVPQFMVWAMRDPYSAPLDKVQIIKSWVENGQTREMIIDVACSNDRVADAQTGLCPASQANVDVSSCTMQETFGAAELKAVWRDTAAQQGETAFYYARVIENPSCRWSSYDALRLGVAAPSTVPATATEMAWSSPIWVNQQSIADR